MAGLIPFNRSTSLNPNPFYNMLDDFFNDAWVAPRRTLIHDTFKLDVKETDNAYTIEAEMPGIQREDIDLRLADDHLTISVTQNEEKNDSTENYIHRERRFASMSRSVFLSNADRENVSAKLEDGVLRVTVPKTAKAVTPNKIEIG